jgi:hypothetical protein
MQVILSKTVVESENYVGLVKDEGNVVGFVLFIITSQNQPKFICYMFIRRMKLKI